jgi:hypothetical protein
VRREISFSIKVFEVIVGLSLSLHYGERDRERERVVMVQDQTNPGYVQLQGLTGGGYVPMHHKKYYVRNCI